MAIQIIPSHPSADGAGVKIQRVHGFRNNGFDPFLMLDEIRSDNPDDYGAGFPAHPHRGIETLTYIRHGGFVHEDHLGNKGEIRSGGSQWISAGRGIIHSEMPLQKDGFMHGFQLWLNLPAKDKMKTPEWQDVQAEQLPWQPLNNAEIKQIAGDSNIDGQTISGPLRHLPASATVADLRLISGANLNLQSGTDRTTLLYVYEGDISLNDQPVTERQIIKVTHEDNVTVSATDSAGLLLLSGIPIQEPVAHYGPFVMNTQEEIDQAVRDYQEGKLVEG